MGCNPHPEELSPARRNGSTGREAKPELPVELNIPKIKDRMVMSVCVWMGCLITLQECACISPCKAKSKFVFFDFFQGLQQVSVLYCATIKIFRTHSDFSN